MSQLFKNNRNSENYFARQKDWINPGIISQIADPVGAALAFNLLISENVLLLETAVDSEVILAFQRLILERGPQDRLMQFFSSICSCQGQAILSNQETCSTMLWMDTRAREKILLHVFEAEDLPLRHWNSGGEGEGEGAAKKRSGSGAPMPGVFLGKSHYLNGFKQVMVSWEKIEALNQFTIYGKKQATMGELCKFLHDDNFRSTNPKRRKQVSEETNTSQRNTTQRNATQRNATQRNTTQHNASNFFFSAASSPVRRGQILCVPDRAHGLNVSRALLQLHCAAPRLLSLPPDRWHRVGLFTPGDPPIRLLQTPPVAVDRQIPPLPKLWATPTPRPGLGELLPQ